MSDETKPIDKFDEILLELKELHGRKRADYAKSGNRFSNFEVSAAFADVAPYQAIEVLIGTKQARLIELRKPNHDLPLNEPIRDTLRDRAVYCILALMYYDETEGHSFEMEGQSTMPMEKAAQAGKQAELNGVVNQGIGIRGGMFRR